MAQPGPKAPLIPEAPQVPQEPQAPQQPALHIPQINWSHFKSEFSGKPRRRCTSTFTQNKWLDRHSLIPGG